MEREGVKQRGVSAFVPGFLPANELSLPDDTGFCSWNIVIANSPASRVQETSYGPVLVRLLYLAIGGDQLWSSIGKPATD